MKTAQIFSGIALGFMIFSTAFSQDDEAIGLYPKQNPPQFYLGITGGYGRVFHSAGIAHPMDNVPNGSPQPHTHPAMDPARANSYFAGIFAEAVLPNGSTSIAFKTFYNDMGTATSIVPGLPYKVVDPQGNPSSTTVQHSSEFTATFINAELIGFQNIADEFSLGFGIGAGFPQEGKIVKKFELLTPSTAAFAPDPEAESKGFYYSEDNRTIFIKNDDRLNKQIYVKLGARYSWMVDNFLIAPSLFYNIGLNNATKNESFRMSTLQLGVDVGFGF
ncbi:MAG: hypothetical protein V4642_00340 [Bacteroidota bacterium]